MAAGMPDPYLAGDRAPLRSWFHLADVPDELIAADEAATLTVVPRRCAAGSTVPGITADGRGRRHRAGAARLRRGRRLHRPPRRAAFFAASPDVTLYLLPGSGHCPQPGRHPAPPVGPPAPGGAETAVTPTLGRPGVGRRPSLLGHGNQPTTSTITGV